MRKKRGRPLTPLQIFDITAARETTLSRLLMLYISTGLLFMLLPGTFLGVWNLLAISSRHAADSVSAAWIQAQGHAQIFGWIGTFILGIGFYSIPKLRRLNSMPNIVSDWKLSKHSGVEVTCETCHGAEHTSASDVAKVKIPTPETCASCHQTQVEQFKHGKHAMAWAAMKAMPTIHWQPMALIEGEKGCGGCHKIGLKSPAEIGDLRHGGSEFGAASCDSCHTRHTFSADEARQPQSCQTCHMGFDHPQWEMYSSSKHGVRQDLKQRKVLPADAAAPTCQTCHMQEGSHEVRTAWGFLAVRLPLPEDKLWAADRATILQALGVLDPDGKPTVLVNTVKEADVARLTQEDWQRECDKMLKTCNQCHSVNFAKQQLQMGDDMIRNADHLMAEGIQVVASLYKDGVLVKRSNYRYAFPNLLTFHDAPTIIEQRLFVMYLEHRMRTFQGTFHASPDYAFSYGWSEMQRDLTEIKERAAEMRRIQVEAVEKPFDRKRDTPPPQK